MLVNAICLFVLAFASFGNAQDSVSYSSDEIGCTANHTFCLDQTACVSDYFFCDGDDDCSDGSDERKEVCKGTCLEGLSDKQFQCKSGAGCVSIRLLCNGVKNCDDGSDEGEELCADCAGFSKLVKCPQTGSKCILKEWFCDSELDCSENDQFDEDPAVCADNCGGQPNRFQCGDKACIYNEAVCTGTNECKDGSDETSELCDTCNGDENRIKCKGSTRCIMKSFLCDGDSDCEDSWDEEGCPASVRDAEDAEADDVDAADADE